MRCRSVIKKWPISCVSKIASTAHMYRSPFGQFCTTACCMVVSELAYCGASGSQCVQPTQKVESAVAMNRMIDSRSPRSMRSRPCFETSCLESISEIRNSRGEVCSEVRSTSVPTGGSG